MGLLTGCATHRGPDLHAVTEDDLGPLLATVRAKVRQLRGSSGPRELRRMFRERGHASNLLEENAGALYVAATFRDLSPRLQRHPMVQDWIRKESPRLARAVFGMATFLDELTEPERRAVGRALGGPHDLGADVVATGTAWTHEQRLDPARESQVTRLLRHGRVALTRESPTKVIDRHISRLDRLSERHGVDWRTWEAALAEPSSATEAEPEEVRRGGVHPLVVVGLVVLGIGAGFALLGASLVAAAASSTSISGLGAATAAAALFALAIVIGLIGLLLLVIGLALPRPRESSMKAFGQDHADLPLTSSTPPAYPEGAASLGVVECPAEVLVDKRGRPTVVRIDDACPEPLREAAREAVMSWRWQPARRRGDRGPRVHARTLVTVRFAP